MSYQDINQHPFNKFYISFKNKDNDLRTVSDMENFDKEIPFSEDLIANSDGERLPIKIDFNSKNSIFVDELTFGNYNKDNIIISENYMDYSKCESGFTICDIGLTGIDNGLVEKMSGETILITNVLLDDSMKFHRTMFDKRMKFFQVTGYTATNNRFS